VSGFLVSFFHRRPSGLGFCCGFSLPVAPRELVFGYVTVERGADHVVTGIVLNIFLFSVWRVCAFKGLFTPPPKRGPRKSRSCQLGVFPWLSVRIDFFGRAAVFRRTPGRPNIAFGAGAGCSLGFLLFPNAVGASASAQRAEILRRGRECWHQRMEHPAGRLLPSVVRWRATGRRHARDRSRLGLYPSTNMTAGRGLYIALALVVLAAWTFPWRIAGAALLFGRCRKALQLRIPGDRPVAHFPHAVLLAVSLPSHHRCPIGRAFAGKGEATPRSYEPRPYPRPQAAGKAGRLAEGPLRKKPYAPNAQTAETHSTFPPPDNRLLEGARS